VVIAVKCDGRPRPIKEGQRGWLGGIDLSTLQLALAPRVIGRGTAKDHEAVVDNGKVIILLLVIALVLLGPLA
jgi:1,4-dihydroxy-2-naphthoate octaprenyltransferase